MTGLVETYENVIVSAEEFQEAWEWFATHISVEPILVEEFGYYLDHKHWQYPDNPKCIDNYDNIEVYLARLYLISQIASVSDYLSNLKNHVITFNLCYASNMLDEELARVIKACETKKHLNAFRNSLSEHLAYWVIVASIIKGYKFQDFSIAKPNLQPEDKGPDGLAYVICSNFSFVDIISVKNSIKSPQNLISSANFRNKFKIDLNEKRILDEFYAFHYHNRGFQRLDDKLNTLLQELCQDANHQIRQVLLNQYCHFNASIIADEQYASNDLFKGFNIISDRPHRCMGIYVGSENWKDLANNVQIEVKKILANKGISF